MKIYKTDGTLGTEQDCASEFKCLKDNNINIDNLVEVHIGEKETKFVFNSFGYDGMLHGLNIEIPKFKVEKD